MQSFRHKVLLREGGGDQNTGRQMSKHTAEPAARGPRPFSSTGIACKHRNHLGSQIIQ